MGRWRSSDFDHDEIKHDWKKIPQNTTFISLSV